MVAEDKLAEIEELLKSLMSKYPDEVRAFMHFLNTVIKEKGLTVKEKELIALALGVATGCEWCITLHAKKALEAGASEEEIVEAAFVAVLMAGGPALMHMIPLMRVIKEFKKK